LKVNIPNDVLLGDAKQLFIVAWPLVLNNLFNIGVNVADTMMAGDLGATQLAAVAIGSSIWITVFLAGLGVIMALGPIVAQHYGAGRKTDIGRDTRACLWLALLISFVVVVVLQYAQVLMQAMNIELEVALLAQGYLDAISFGVLGCYGYHCLRQMNEGLGRTVPIMIIMGGSLPINVGLNYLFMYGKFGCPALGAVGAGLGSGLTFWFMFLFISLYTSKSIVYRQYDLWRGFESPNWSAMRHILAVGVPIGGSFMLQAALFTVVALIMGSFGTVVIAAHAVTLNFASLVFMIPLGIAMATTALVGQAIGRAEPRVAKRIGLVGISMCLLVMCISASCTIAYAQDIASLYSRDASVIRLAAALLVIAAIMQLGDGCQVAAAGALRGLKDTRVTLLINATVYWGVGFTVAYYAGVRLDYGPFGVWFGLCCCLWTAGIWLSLRFRSVINRRIRADEPGSGAPLII
jgi:multidrug resistance protein, MATE family